MSSGYGAEHSGREALVDVLEGAEPLYLLPKDDVAELVTSPALAASDRADIMIGFFASQSLSEIAPGLASFLSNTSEPLRLIVSPFLTSDDQRALTEADAIGELAAAKFSAALPDADALGRHALECLAWLVSLGRLQLKIALMRDALFHPKVWLFGDGRDRAALHGSANMTGAGLGRNREQLSLSRAWNGGDGLRACTRLSDEFELLWGGGDADCVVVDLPQAIADRLIEDYKTSQSPTEDDFRRLWRRSQGLPEVTHDVPDHTGNPSEPEFRVPDWLDYRTGDFAHQGEAIDAWQASGRRGILEMCTGSGKTLTAMVGAHGLYAEVGPLLIVVSAPYKVLLQQWCNEIALFGLSPINLSEEAGAKGREQAISNARRRLRLGIAPAEALVVSNDTLCTPEFVSQIAKFGGPKLLIADECHNLGAAGFIRQPPTYAAAIIAWWI